MSRHTLAHDKHSKWGIGIIGSICLVLPWSALYVCDVYLSPSKHLSAIHELQRLTYDIRVVKIHLSILINSYRRGDKSIPKEHVDNLVDLLVRKSATLSKMARNYGFAEVVLLANQEIMNYVVQVYGMISPLDADNPGKMTLNEETMNYLSTEINALLGRITDSIDESVAVKSESIQDKRKTIGRVVMLSATFVIFIVLSAFAYIFILSRIAKLGED